jgi:hypothetical protein
MVSRYYLATVIPTCGGRPSDGQKSEQRRRGQQQRHDAAPCPRGRWQRGESPFSADELDDHRGRRNLAMNSILWLRMAWSVWPVQSLSGESLRMKTREERMVHTADISVCIRMTRGWRSGGECQRTTFSSRRRFRKLNPLNGILIAWTETP